MNVKAIIDITMAIDITANGKRPRSMASARTSGVMDTVIRDSGWQERKVEAANTLGRTVIGMWVSFMKATIMVKGCSLTSLEKR